MKYSGALIIFTGIDGSGKSTQAQLLTERLTARGLPAEYVWARWEPCLLKPAVSLLKKLARPKGKVAQTAGGGDDPDAAEYRRRKGAKGRILGFPGVKHAWLVLACFDYYFQVRRRIIRPLRAGKTVVCDRYRPDFVADLAINFGYRGDALVRLSRHFLMRAFPDAILSFYIDIPPEVGFRRKSDGTSREYLADRISVYAEVARLEGMRYLDGTLPVEEICHLVDAELR